MKEYNLFSTQNFWCTKTHNYRTATWNFKNPVEEMLHQNFRCCLNNLSYCHKVQINCWSCLNFYCSYLRIGSVVQRLECWTGPSSNPYLLSYLLAYFGPMFSHRLTTHIRLLDHKMKEGRPCMPLWASWWDKIKHIDKTIKYSPQIYKC